MGPNKDPWNIFYPGMMVTDRCSDPNLAVALYNYMIDFEVSMDGYIGPKGEAWDDPRLRRRLPARRRSKV